MILWLLLGAMTVGVLVILLRPLLRSSDGDAPSRGAHDIEIYRDQLRELEREAADGLIDADAAATARLEIERRILAAGAGAEGRARRSGPARATAAVLAVLLPAAAAALYLTLGSPQIPGAPLADRLAEGGPAAGAEALAARIAALEQATRENAANVGAWVALARGYRDARRYQESATAFERATALAPERSALKAAYAEALILAADGVVTTAARSALDEAMAAEPDSPRARYYLGLAEWQAGNPDRALAIWVDLEAASPPGAPWLAPLDRQITALAEDAGVGAAGLATMRDRARASATPLAPAPTEPGRGAEAMTPAEQEETIRGMVASLATRLEESPDDPAGWRRLGRSYLVLGEPDKAMAALERGAEVAPENVDLLIDYGEAILAAEGGDDALPARFVEVMRRVAAIEPENPVALWYLGEAALQEEKPAQALALWQRLVVQLPEGSDERRGLQQRIDTLEALEK